MARTTGPLMSLSASGSIAGTLTYAHWRGRPYVRQLVTPSNPNTGAQVGVRAMMKFLSQSWATIITPNQGSWQDLAKAGQFSEFNAYVKTNLKLWRDFNPPSQMYPATHTGTPETFTQPTATGGVRQITIATTVNANNDPWGFAIFRETTTGFSPAFNNAIAIVNVQALSGGDPISFLDTPLDPDTYYYRFGSFTSDGVIDTTTMTEVNATVT